MPLKHRIQGDQGLLGLGCMRLPILNDDPTQIDYEKTFELFDAAVSQGLTYFDTAYVYHGGNSEKVIGAYFGAKGKRQIKVATKLPVWMVKTQDDIYRLVDEQLERLNVETIDNYLLHAMNKTTWANMLALDIFSVLEKLKASGKISKIGFSFHDESQVFQEILNYYSWDFCQIQLNYMDENYQAGLAGLHLAKEKGIHVIVMEPLRGGSLTNSVPSDIQAIWATNPVQKTPAAWAFDYLYNQEGVDLVLSGMGTIAQLTENVEVAKASFCGMLSENEQNLIKHVADTYRSRIQNNCTDCGYCMPCEFGVNIPRTFKLYNQSFMFDDQATYKVHYNQMPKESRADQCTACGQCEGKCPQNIGIINDLKSLSAYFEA